MGSGLQSSHGGQDPASDSLEGLHGCQCQPFLSEMGESIKDHSLLSFSDFQAGGVPPREG